MATWLQSWPHGHVIREELDHAMDTGDVLSRAKRYVISQGFIEQSRFVGIYITFIILSLITNGFMMVVIPASRTMMSSSRHVLIISVCLGDLLMGVFVLPVLLNLGLHGGQNSDDGCTTFHVMRLFADFLLPSITTLAVVALNIDYILRISCSAYGEGVARVVILVCLFLMPWVISCSVLIPFYVDALNSSPSMIAANTCADVLDLKLRGKMTRTLLIVSFFPQAFILFVFNIIVTTLYLLKRDSFGIDVCGERIRAPVDICLASFTTLVLYTPIFLISLLTTQGYLGCVGDEECSALKGVYIAAIWCYFGKSWLLPFSWLACRDTRAYIKKRPG